MRLRLYETTGGVMLSYILHVKYGVNKKKHFLTSQSIVLLIMYVGNVSMSVGMIQDTLYVTSLDTSQRRFLRR